MPSKKIMLTVVCLAALIVVTLTIMNFAGDNPSQSIYNDSDVLPVTGSFNQDIMFSATDYFYAETVMLELTTSDYDVVEIYYTLDGASPDSAKGVLYTREIKLTSTSTDEQMSYVVKACGKKEDGSFTDVYTHSYFIGSEINERFDVLVFSLSTDPYNLYDYDYGIFVGGRLRDEYIAETGDKDPDPPAPANYNLRGRESERPVFVEVFDQNGNLLISQNAGMRTFGGWSRAMDQRSIKLYARSEYDPVNNHFDYSFFPDNRTYAGFLITKYKRLVLRNNANDSPFAFLRDESILSMAELTNLQDVSDTRPAAVFLNGEYYGFVWVHEVYDEDYLDDKNGIKDGKWAILEGSESNKSEEPEDPLNLVAVADYNEVYSFCNLDLTDDKTFDEFLERVDIDNFLTYYAVQIYVANGDWPRNNYKVYRYFGDDADSSIGGSTKDGKWRWLIYDTDFGLGLYDCKPSEPSLGILLGSHGEDSNMASPLLAAVLQRQDMKERFVSIMCDLMNHQFSPRNITISVREKEALRMQELEFDFKHGGFQLKNSWSSMEFVSGQVNQIIIFGVERPAEMKKQILNYLGIADSGYTVYVNQCETADIMINSCLLNEDSQDFKGFYYNINTVTVSAQPVFGYRFSHWLVNGKTYNNPLLSLTVEDAEKNEIYIELVTVKADAEPVPVIKMIDYEGDLDYLQIYNPFDSDIDLKKYYISDNGSNLYKQSVADYILKPGETLSLYCKNYKNDDASHGFSLDFNLKNNETLYISDSNGDIVQELFLPKINNEHIYVRDIRMGSYYDIPSDNLK